MLKVLKTNLKLKLGQLVILWEKQMKYGESSVIFSYFYIMLNTCKVRYRKSLASVKFRFNFSKWVGNVDKCH